jgi:hypothetical protein
MLRYQEAAEPHTKAAAAFTQNPTEYTKYEVDHAKNNLDKVNEEVKESNIFNFSNKFPPPNLYKIK